MNKLFLEINNCLFLNNFSPGDAIIRSNSNSQIKITNSTFIENYSFGKGSCIFADFK